MDSVEATSEKFEAVTEAKLKVFGEINSVSELASHNREMGDLQARLKVAEKNIGKMEDLHNGKHPGLDNA